MKNKLPLSITLISTFMLVLIVLFIDNVTVSSIDDFWYREIISKMSPGITLSMRFITEMGNTLTIIILCISFFLFMSTRKKWAIPIASSVMIASTANIILKFVFGRDRPHILRLIEENDFSFPSGHAMNNAALYTTLLLLTLQYVENKKLKIIISIICILMPILIGISRIYLGVHYATDVIAGWLLGITISVMVFIYFNKKEGKK